MLPFIGRPYKGPSRLAVIGTRVSNSEHDSGSSGSYCIERDVGLLGNPDAMEQDSELASDGDDGSIA